jgi:4-hydroxy 2-oxovalerate aldolase
MRAHSEAADIEWHRRMRAMEEKKISLLDCTLRDGGYVNDWKFGRENLKSIFERDVDAGVDIIEIGFLDDRRPFDEERSIMPTTECADRIFGKLDRKNAMVVGMIDYGTCDIKNIAPCRDSYLDGIRVIFKKHLMHPAMEYVRKVKALGYKVFAQLVSITTFTDEDMMELIGLVNDVKPYAVSMVDTYGLMHNEDLLHYYQLLDNNVDPEIGIGFHAHNNFQMAYSNSLAFLAKPGKHNIVVDGTLYGMGKSAGNAPIELIAMTLNEKYGKNYNINAMMEAIDESILDIYARSPWGYKEFFYLCSKNKCHPNYETYFKAKKNLSTSKLDDLMGTIEPEPKKLLYDKEVAEKTYNDYVAKNIPEKESEKALLEDIGGRPLLLVGPGKNVVLEKDKVAAFIGEKKPYVISVNYVPEEIAVNCVFVTNIRRYHDMTITLAEKPAKVLATSNVECRNGRFDFVINRAPLLEEDEKITDNSFLMLLKFLRRIGVKEVFCVGFDGYSERGENYRDSGMEYYFIKQEASYLNYHMRRTIEALRKDMTINFVTYSAYDAVEDINSASI